MTRPLDVTLMMDAAWLPADEAQLDGEDLPSPLMERHVAIALRELGHTVRVVAVGHELTPVIAELETHRPDVVFNLVEQFQGDRRLSTNLICLLELMEIPFTGTGSTGLLLCQDKGLCKQLLNFHRIHVPRFEIVAPGRRRKLPAAMGYPLIVKPMLEEGSEGIVRASVVNSDEELADRLRIIHDNMHQPAIVEQFIDGRELYVAVMGNHRLSVFPPRELFLPDGSNAPVIATGRVKHDDAYREKWNIRYDFAAVEPELGKHIARVARRAYRVMQLRGYARIDMRVTAEGRIYILEVNANPDIAYGEDYAESAAAAGVDYNAMIQKFLNLALRE